MIIEILGASTGSAFVALAINVFYDQANIFISY